jgi:hypothetical protein
MYVLDLIMKKSISWQKPIASWIKEKQLGKGARGLQRENQSVVIPYHYLRRPIHDLESLGTRALLGRNSVGNSQEGRAEPP